MKYLIQRGNPLKDNWYTLFEHPTYDLAKSHKRILETSEMIKKALDNNYIRQHYKITESDEV